MHALILGGRGSSGRALIRQLRGGGPPVEVSLVSRTDASPPGVATVITGHYGDLASSAEFRRRLARVDVIVHLADGLAVLQEGRSRADRALAERLLATSERLAVAAREAGVPRFVHVSSIKAICDEDDARVLVETSEPRCRTLYGRSKLGLERRLTEVLTGSDTRLTVVRNPVMYGVGRAGSVRRLLRLADTFLPLPLGGVRNRRSLLAVENFASALGAVIRAGPEAPAGTFHVHDGPPLSTVEIVAILRGALGRPERLFPIGAGGMAVAKRVPLIAPAARRLFASLELSDAHFRRTYNWTPSVETKVALADMASAYAAGPAFDAIGATAVRRG